MRIGEAEFFRELAARGCFSEQDVHRTGDGFFAATKSLADLLAVKGITTFRNAGGQIRQCNLYFDDWYLYAVEENGGVVYSLFKMREQEHDAEHGVMADGDQPGVTVPFIAFDTGMLSRCLDDPTGENREALNREINRVVADRGQRHHPILKAYFCRPEAEGPYLIAELYVRFLAGLAQNGSLDVPETYRSIYRKSRSSGFRRLYGRLPRFLDANNDAAGYSVCDHARIYLRDPGQLSPFEKAALLATHTADVSFHSFAAEVQYHARFLEGYARIPFPFLGRSVYDSAIRADLSIDESAPEELAPFHWEKSLCVRRQKKLHGHWEPGF